MKKVFGLAIVVALLLGIADFFDAPSQLKSAAKRYITGRDGPASALRNPEHEKRKLRSWPAINIDNSSLAAGLLRVAPDEASVTRGFERALVSIDGDRRLAMGGAVPHVGTATVEVPEAASSLRFAIDHSGGGLRGEIRYAIRIETLASEGDAETVFSLERPVHSSGWQDHRIDLSRWAGERIRLSFDARFVSDGVAAAQAFWGNVAVRTAPDVARPNLVVILLDTLRADHLGTYGYERNTSPFMDSLAAGGVRFDHAFSNAPWTDPSILSLMTGLYPSDLWKPGGTRRSFGERTIPEEIECFPESLAAGGYETVALIDHPAVRAGRYGQGFDTYRMMNNGRGATVTTPPAEVLRHVEEVLAGSGGAGVFLYLHLLYPHLPYEAPAGYHGLFGPGERAEVRGNREGLLNLYDAQIRLSDDVVAALMDLFDRLTLGDDLVVAIVSDHGESFWDHDRFAHGNSLYNELLHVPLIFHGPGRIPKGNVVEGIVQVMDIGATLLDLAGLPQPSDKRGASLLPAMHGGATPRLSAFSEFPYRRIPSGQTIQTRDAKWIIDQRSAEAHRFDLTTDPAEMKPNATIRADVESLLSTALAEIQSSAEKHRASAGKAKTETVSDETESQLRALGYTE